MKGWHWDLGLAEPDPINTESIGKTPRYWICLVQYSKGAGTLDGPGVIHVDLQSEVASWEETL